jgi:hypothetical protein
MLSVHLTRGTAAATSHQTEISAALPERAVLWFDVDHAVRLLHAAVDSFLCSAHLAILQRPAVGTAAVGVIALLLLLLLLLLLKEGRVCRPGAQLQSITVMLM